MVKDKEKSFARCRMELKMCKEFNKYGYLNVNYKRLACVHMILTDNDL